MEAIKSMNNQQRKMLDEIYSEQFKTKERIILDDRQVGLQKLKDKVLKEEAKSTAGKAILSAAAELRKASDKYTQELESRGLRVNGLPHRSDWGGLAFNSSYPSVTHPTLLEYEEETNRIRVELAQRKKEIRARIYGLNTTYEEVDKEIQKYLEGMKI